SVALVPDVRVVQVMPPSTDPMMRPPLPTTTMPCVDAATPCSVSVTLLARAVHATPAGEVASAPAGPTPTTWLPGPEPFHMRCPVVGIVIGVRGVQVSPSSVDVARQDPISEVPTAINRLPSPLLAMPA